MKKGIIAVIVAVIIIGVGSYFVFYKPPKSTTASTPPSPSSSTQAAVVNNAVLTTKTSSSIGSYLADPNGKALYTYGSDTSGVSNCTGGCLAVWPAYQVTGSTTNLPTNVGTIKRSDNGEMQYTYQGLPLYYFASDSDGSVTGNGVSGFKVAVPASAPVSQPTASPSSSSSSNPY
jgi:predicted lipoprotein with Yx(FWY)xxD motif